MTYVRFPSKQDYFEKVWQFVRKVPCGKVVTYGQIAEALPEPDSSFFEGQETSLSQLVGSAMSASPDDVPWHRVINAQGRVSNLANAQQQRQLLEAEGVFFHKERVSLEESQWHSGESGGTPHQQPLF